MLTNYVMACFGDATDGAPDPPTSVSTSLDGANVVVAWSGGNSATASRIYVNSLFLVEVAAGGSPSYGTGYPLALTTCVQVSHVSAAGLESSATKSTSGVVICP